MAGENKSYKGWYLFVIIVIVFALSAPYLFTRNGIIDFTETGQIGDTIGGTMGPFIALAGVIVTFLAFLMQKKANDIISDQHEGDKKREEEKLQNEYSARVELLKSDIKNAKLDIKQRIGLLEEHKTDLLENPYRTLRLKETAANMYNRMSDCNRDNLFIALTGLNISEPDKILQKYYSIADYLGSAVILARNITDDQSNETYRNLIEIKNSIDKIYSISKAGFIEFYKIQCVTEFIECTFTYKHPNGETNFLKLGDCLLTFEKDVRELINSHSYKECENDLQKIIILCQNAMMSYNNIQIGSTQIVNSIDEIIREFTKMIQRCEIVLEDIKKYNS